MNKGVGAIILAAGKGTRFHEQKQFVHFIGKPLWRHTYDTALAVIPKENIVVVGVDIMGGETRSKSVLAGLNHLHDIAKVVIIDAARPLLRADQIQNLIDCKALSISSVMPVVDTVITTDKQYLDRSKCLRLQSPQAFDFELLKKAYSTGKYPDMTDDTRVMFEEYGIAPEFVTGGENLFKVTYPQDLEYLKSFLRR